MLSLEPLPRALDAALRDVHDRKAAVRASAVRDLSVHAVGEATPRVVAALTAALADVSAEVRGAAAVALADAGARDALGALNAAADDTHLHVRQMALLALGELARVEDAAVLATIQARLGDAAPALRFQALIAASRVGAPFAGDALVAALSDPDAEVRHVAVRALEERGTDDSGRVTLAGAAEVAIRRALGDTALTVRVAAAIFLGHAGSAEGARVIVEALAARTGRLEPEDELSAIALAGRLGLDAARPALSRRAFGLLGPRRDPFAHEARIALALMGDPRSRGAILRGLRSSSRVVRTSSAVEAGRVGLAVALPLLRELRGDPRRADPEAVEAALAAIEQ